MCGDGARAAAVNQTYSAKDTRTWLIVHGEIPSSYLTCGLTQKTSPGFHSNIRSPWVESNRKTRFSRAVIRKRAGVDDFPIDS